MRRIILPPISPIASQSRGDFVNSCRFRHADHASDKPAPTDGVAIKSAGWFKGRDVIAKKLQEMAALRVKEHVFRQNYWISLDFYIIRGYNVA